MKVNTYNQEGRKTGLIDLPDGVFAVRWSADLVHDTVVAMQSNRRTHVAHTKDRSEVSGGGRKPWRQKGTGRARHGSIRSPIWRGGGATFGPRNERNFEKKINKKARAKSLAMILSQKLKDNEVMFVDTLNFDGIKTAHAKDVLRSLSKVENFAPLAAKKRNAAFITTNEKNENVIKSFQNMGNVAVDEIRNISVLDLLTYKYLIVSNPKEGIEILKSRVGGRKDDDKKIVKAPKPTAKKAVKKVAMRTRIVAKK